ncbi:hypothetical protein ACW23B_00680 [Streptomyces albidoflavus]
MGAELYNVRPAAGFIYYSYYSGLDWGLHHKAGLNEQWFGTWPTNDDLSMLAVICSRAQLKEFRQDVDNCFHAVFDDVDRDMGAQLRYQGRREEDFKPMRYPDNYYRRPYGPGVGLGGRRRVPQGPVHRLGHDRRLPPRRTARRPPPPGARR